jgi:hypothetical protein
MTWDSSALDEPMVHPSMHQINDIKQDSVVEGNG